MIAGLHAGIPVRCTPQAQPIYDNLLLKASQGNHWARLVVKGIESLTASLLHLNNVFVKASSGGAYGNGRFIMTLPGCVATFEKVSESSFILWHLMADANYFALQEEAKRPGLYAVKKQGDDWKAEFIPTGRITTKENRVVAITDRRGAKPGEIAGVVSYSISASPASGGSVMMNKTGFDMHFTPGNPGHWRLEECAPGDAGGQRPLPARIRHPAGKNHVCSPRHCWRALDLGARGSGVLTQAMKILATQGVKLDKHMVYMSNLTDDYFNSKIIPEDYRQQRTAIPDKIDAEYNGQNSPAICHKIKLKIQKNCFL